MTDIATRTEHSTDEIVALLGLNPRDPKTHAMVAVCSAYHLDPLLKHVVVIPGGGVYITRDGLLHIAHRSGQLDGIEIVSGPDLVDGEWRVTVSVYRKDMSRPFTFPGRYPVSGGNRKYAPEMALKVAESMALRRAFDVSGLGIVDEQLPDEQPQQRAPQSRPTPARPIVDVPDDIVDAEVVDEAVPAGGAETASPVGVDPQTGARIPFGPGALMDPKSASSRKMYALLRERVTADKGESLEWLSGQVGRVLASSAELTQAEQSRILDALDRLEPLSGGAA